MRLLYFYAAALFGLVVAVIALIIAVQILMSGSADGTAQAFVVVLIGAGVWFIHLMTASNQAGAASRASAGPGDTTTGARTSAHWSTLLYLRLVAFLGMILFVFGLIGAIDALVDAAFFDDHGVDAFSQGSSFFPTFEQDRGDILIRAFKSLISGAVGFLLMRVHLTEADKRS